MIGHSFGGLIVQRLLGQNLAAAGVAIDPAPIKGVLYLPPSALKVASIALRQPGQRARRAVSLTPKQFRYGFGNALPEAESRRALRPLDDPLPGQAAVRGRGREPRCPGSPAKVDTGNRPAARSC